MAQVLRRIHLDGFDAWVVGLGVPWVPCGLLVLFVGMGGDLIYIYIFNIYIYIIYIQLSIYIYILYMHLYMMHDI